jgi:hypothetical protein
MEDWVTIENAEKTAKSEMEKRKVFRAILRKAEKDSPLELEEALRNTSSKLITEQVKLELWWRGFPKDPEKLLEFIKTAKDKDKIERVITELGEIKHKGATNTIINYLDDIDLRDAAALFLRDMPTQEAFVPLVEGIKKHPDGSECLLYALEVIDCSDAAELLVDLYISMPNAILAREDICTCFEQKAVKKIPENVKNSCCQKLHKAIENTTNKDDAEDMNRLLELVMEVEAL